MRKTFAFILAFTLCLSAAVSVVAEEGVYYAKITGFTAVYDEFTQNVEFCVEFDGAVVETEEFVVRLYCTVLDPLENIWVEDQTINIYQLSFGDHLKEGNRLTGALPIRKDVFFNSGYRDFRISISGKTAESNGTVYYTINSADIPIGSKAAHGGQAASLNMRLLPAQTAIGGYVLLKLSVADIPATLSGGLTNLDFVLNYDADMTRIESVDLESKGESWDISTAFVTGGMEFALNGGGVYEDGDLVVTVKLMTLKTGNCDFVVSKLGGGDGYGHGFLEETTDFVATLNISGDMPLIGDVNGDGAVDNLDAAWVLQYDAGIRTGIRNGDVNGDGNVNSLDAARILKYDAGITDRV